MMAANCCLAGILSRQPTWLQDVGAGAAALAQAAAATPPSPRPQQPKRTPAPAVTDSASAASPAADSPVSSFIPPSTDPNTVYLQVSSPQTPVLLAQGGNPCSLLLFILAKQSFSVSPC